jgi:hypothetical protein
MLAYIEERPGFDDWPPVTVTHLPDKLMVCVSDGTRAESAPIYDVRLLSDMVHNEWPHIAAEIVRQALNPPDPDTEPRPTPRATTSGG